MTVYIDDYQAQYGRMVMCHMIADNTEELHAMAARIGVAARHIQKPATAREHFDISKSMRRVAVLAGAVEITARQAAAMTGLRALGEAMGHPATAITRYRLALASTRAKPFPEAAIILGSTPGNGTTHPELFTQPSEKGDPNV